MKTHRRPLRLIGLLLLLGFGLRCAPPAAAQSEAVIVRLAQSSYQIGRDQIETVTVLLEDVEGAYAIELRAAFDPAVVEVVDADPAAEGVQMTPGDFLKPDFPVRNTADNQAGTLQYVVTQVNPTPPASGSGAVLNIQFRGKAQGRQSPFTITFAAIADRRGNKLTVKPVDGTLAVVAPKPLTPTPIVTTAPRSTNPPIAAGFPYVEVTPTPAPADAQAARDQPSGAPDARSMLILVAGGGFGGASLLLIIAVIVVRRRKPRPS